MPQGKKNVTHRIAIHNLRSSSNLQGWWTKAGEFAALHAPKMVEFCLKELIPPPFEGPKI